MSLYDGETTVADLVGTLNAISTVGDAAMVNIGKITVLTFGPTGDWQRARIGDMDYEWGTTKRSAGSISRTGNHSLFRADVADTAGKITRNEAIFGNGTGTIPPITTSILQAPPGYEVEGAFPATTQFTNTQQPTTEQSGPFQVSCL